MEGLLVQDNCWIKVNIAIFRQRERSKQTFRSEAGVCEVLGLGFGFAHLEFGFLGGSVRAWYIHGHSAYLEVLLLLLLSFRAGSHACGWNWRLVNLRVQDLNSVTGNFLILSYRHVWCDPNR